MRASTERWGARHSRGVCRSAYGTVLACCGDWKAAEVEMTAALGDFETARPGMAGGGLVRLAELRARQGRVDEARELYERAGTHRLAVLGLGGLALDAGDARRPPMPPSVSCVGGRRQRAASDACAGAARAGARCAGRARRRGRGVRGARGRGTGVRDSVRRRSRAPRRGELAMAQGGFEEARRAYEDALDRFGDAGAPYDAARPGWGWRSALAGLGRASGRRPKRRRRARVRRAGGETRGRPCRGAAASGANGATWGGLTPRELEILRLVAQGLNNGEIAERLVVSPHTVHRHVANVRTKLRLPSRAAAVAYAARVGLL